jgi:hypothetical protein
VVAKSFPEGAASSPRPGARKGRWSRDEIERLRESYGLKEDEVIARELQRSVTSVRRMAQSLFSAAPRSGSWSEEEVEQLKLYLGATQISIIARIISRTTVDVERKIAELATIRKHGPWTLAEIALFKRLYGTRTDQDLSCILSRSVDSIHATAERLCLAKDKSFLRRRSGGERSTKMPRWSAAELEILKKHYPSSSNLDIAQRLDRSVKSVVSKAHHMGLKKDVERLREMGRENVRLRYESQD